MIEGQPAADLRHLEGDATGTGGEAFVLEAIRVAEALLTVLVGFCVEGAKASAGQGRIDENSHALGKAARSLFGEELQDGGQAFKIFGVHHGSVGVDVFVEHPNNAPP